MRAVVVDEFGGPEVLRVRPDRSVLDLLREMVDAGTMRPLVDAVLPLEQAAEAHRRLESRHGRGKVILPGAPMAL